MEAVGVESESRLPFAALATIAAPLVDHLARLPERQRRALEGALALGPPADGDRLAVAAATVVASTTRNASKPQAAILFSGSRVRADSFELQLF